MGIWTLLSPLPMAAIWLSQNRFFGRILDEWGDDTQEFIRLKLPHLLLVAIIAFVLNKLLSLASAHMIRVAELHAGRPARISQVKTLAGVIRATGLAVIALIASLQFLAALGANLAPLLASAGVAGIAVGLAAQNIVKDVFNGVLILLENQFNVGDQVRLAGIAGTVEAMTLRQTTVRDADGTLYVVPNSQIGTVANVSAGYSLATVNVSVDFSAHPDEVRALLAAIVADLRACEEFRGLWADEPQILGLDAIKGSELIFPVVFKTPATKQYALVREFRRRVRLALEQKRLLPGDPYRIFGYDEHQSGHGRPPAGEEPGPVRIPPAKENSGLFGSE